MLVAKRAAELSYFEEFCQGEIAGGTGKGRGEARYFKELGGWIALCTKITKEGN